MFDINRNFATTGNNQNWTVVTTTTTTNAGDLIYFYPEESKQFTSGYLDWSIPKEEKSKNQKCEYCGCFSEKDKRGNCVCCGAPKEK